jgi:hypothetical protein
MNKSYMDHILLSEFEQHLLVLICMPLRLNFFCAYSDNCESNEPSILGATSYKVILVCDISWGYNLDISEDMKSYNSAENSIPF